MASQSMPALLYLKLNIIFLFSAFTVVINYCYGIQKVVVLIIFFRWVGLGWVGVYCSRGEKLSREISKHCIFFNVVKL